MAKACNTTDLSLLSLAWPLCAALFLGCGTPKKADGQLATTDASAANITTTPSNNVNPCLAAGLSTGTNATTAANTTALLDPTTAAPVTATSPGTTSTTNSSATSPTTTSADNSGAMGSPAVLTTTGGDATNGTGSAAATCPDPTQVANNTDPNSGSNIVPITNGVVNPPIGTQVVQTPTTTTPTTTSPTVTTPTTLGGGLLPNLPGLPGLTALLGGGTSSGGLLGGFLSQFGSLTTNPKN